jgi:ADP-ribosylglycohydrolase
MNTYAERIEGGVLGLLIGDALGVPYEFHLPQDLPPIAQIEMEPPSGFHRAHKGTPPGTWSDDGAQALVLLESLLRCGQLDLDDFARGLVAWHDSGFMAVDHRVFDVGIQTRQAIANLKSGVPPDEAGPHHERANGNGALMRVLPLALWHRGSDEDLVADARRQSLVTHGHLRSQLCCALYCLWARRELEGHAASYDAALATLRTLLGDGTAERAELDEHIRPDQNPGGRGSGYLVDSLHSARLALQQPDYQSVVKAAVAIGEDTDTTACIAGGIAGIRFGSAALPTRWRAALRGQDIVEPLLAALLAR